MTNLSSRERDAFDNPTKAACREGSVRVLREAAYCWAERISKMNDGKEE